MKNLSKYIKEKLIVFHPQIDEKLVINKSYNQYQYKPKTWDELRQIIKERYEKLGLGTEQNPVYFNDIDVSKITTFYDESNNKGIFEGTEFEYINISDWNVSKIKDMCKMFNECSNLKSIGDLSNWEVSKVKDMSFMFNECSNLKSIGDLSNWEVSKVKDMHYMFDSCEKLKSVGNLSKWDVSNVKDMAWMFNKCKKEIIPDWYWYKE